MANCLSCGDTSPSTDIPQQNETTGCPTIVNQTVCVQGTVTITPKVVTGLIKNFCVGDPMIGSCPGKLVDKCCFTVSQNICVQVPLRFFAAAVVTPNGIVSGTPAVGEYENTPPVSTYTNGFFRNNPEVTEALITDFGGSIILGIDDDGLSFTVTAANAWDVLSFNTPSPPAPDSPPFAGQYQVLYAQLLAANLNFLRGATCLAAIEAIASANAFLAASPAGGMAGAPKVQEPLAAFNEGLAPGYPDSCID